MSDEKIIQMLREGKDTVAFTKLYDHLPKVEKLIRNNSGSNADARDIFQDALIIFHQKVKGGELKLTASIGTFLYSICRNLWMDELRRRKKQPSAELHSEFSAADESEKASMKERLLILAEKAIRQTGKKCEDLLIKFYIHKMSMQDIARQLGYSSVNTAKTRKYKCLERAKQNLRTINASEIDPMEMS